MGELLCGGSVRGSHPDFSSSRQSAMKQNARRRPSGDQRGSVSLNVEVNTAWAGRPGSKRYTSVSYDTTCEGQSVVADTVAGVVAPCPAISIRSGGAVPSTGTRHK